MKTLCAMVVAWGLCGTASAADRLESDMLRTAGTLGLPSKPDLVQKELLSRREHHEEELEREWKRTTKDFVKSIPAVRVNTKDGRERKAVVRFRTGGSWVHRSGSMRSAEKVLLSVGRGVSECWVKHSLSKTYHLGAEISHSPGIPSRYYYSHGQEIRWRKCSWDARRNRWALITSDQRKKVESDYRNSLRAKLRETQAAAGRGPDKRQLDKARRYAERADSYRKKPGTKENRFRVESDVGMGYFRLVFAYDKAILAEAIEAHMKSFRGMAWGS